MKIISLVLFIGLFLPFSALAESNISIDKATKNIFPSFQEYKLENRILDNQKFKVFTVFKDGKVMGWAVVLDEMGKIKPITFLVGIDNQYRVIGVYVLEYRDMFGAEVRRRSFLRQFQGKTLKDYLMVGRDIDAVTGATISSHAAASAVKKTLQLIQEIQKDSFK